jgi:hypothetical protein
MRFIYSFILMFLVSAEVNATCLERREKVADSSVEMHALNTETCWLLLGPDLVPDMVYRSYLFDNSGFMMIFNSYGEGPESTTTGAREMYIFPRGGVLDYRITDSEVTAVLPSGIELTYDAKAFRWSGTKGAKVKEKSQIKVGDQGGIEISIQSGLILDFGFRLGNSPTGDPARKANFVDSIGNRCTVVNRDVLEWDKNGEPYLRFKSDEAVYDFVRLHCPNLKF